MNSVVVFLILLGSFPFLFPEVCRAWLERAQQWLRAYENEQQRQWHAECALEEERQEWEQWVQHAKRTLHRTKNSEERLLLLAQLKAAGERYLAGVARWEEGKLAHPTLKKVEEKTKGVLDLLSNSALDRPRDPVR